jgi:hypothetical protein
VSGNNLMVGVVSVAGRLLFRVSVRGLQLLNRIRGGQQDISQRIVIEIQVAKESKASYNCSPAITSVSLRLSGNGSKGIG